MAITFDRVEYSYEAKTMWQQAALSGVNLELAEGQFTAIAGASGSGKSTLLQMFNGILRPTAGTVQVLDATLRSDVKPKGLRELRKRVGLVFQFPEHQLFEDTVEKDLIFGPLNFGMSLEQAKQQARRALNLLGLEEGLLERSPFHLSGGQMRKVAIASVLAAEPDVVVLDEPTATLDPVSRLELIELLSKLCHEEGKTIIMVTHRMDEVLPYADHWVVMKQGGSIFEGSPKELVQNAARLEEEGLSLPESVHCWKALADHFGLGDEKPCFTPEAVAARLARLLPMSDDAVEGG